MPGESRKGRLKIYLGYAAGVGKTYQMLEEAQELKRQRLDVVIGYFETHGRKDTISVAQGLEMVPRKQMQYRGTVFEEMDTDAILRRNPQICVVDEFPHTNVPGSEQSKRWQDVVVLLEGGIDVLTTMNVQHLESLNDQIWHITGVRVRETIPDWVMKQADEVVMVDLTPQALLNRLERGVVYSHDKARRALENFFKEPTLVALRELAMRQTAHEVELRQAPAERIEAFREQATSESAAESALPAPANERILVHVTADPSTAMLLRRGRRVADYLHTDCLAVCIHSQPQWEQVPLAERQAIERHLSFARGLRIETSIIQGHPLAKSLVDFARQNRITQIYVSRANSEPRRWLAGLSFIDQLIQQGRDLQVAVVAEHKHAGRSSVTYAEEPASTVTASSE